MYHFPVGILASFDDESSLHCYAAGYFAPGRAAKYCDEYVCLSVRPRA